MCSGGTSRVCDPCLGGSAFGLVMGACQGTCIGKSMLTDAIESQGPDSGIAPRSASLNRSGVRRMRRAMDASSTLVPARSSASLSRGPAARPHRHPFVRRSAAVPAGTTPPTCRGQPRTTGAQRRVETRPCRPGRCGHDSVRAPDAGLALTSAAASSPISWLRKRPDRRSSTSGTRASSEYAGPRSSPSVVASATKTLVSGESSDVSARVASVMTAIQ